MATTILSSKGQIIIPEPICTAHHWEPGQKFEAIDTGDAILLKPAGPFQKTDLKEVASCLRYNGPTKTIQEMNEAINQGAKAV